MLVETNNVVPLNSPGMEPPLGYDEDEGDPYRDLPDPLTGKKRRWVRSTTFAKTVANLHNIFGWEKRCIARGFAQRPDLVLRVASVPDPDSLEDPDEQRKAKRQLDNLCEQAKEVAKGGAGANRGTALHGLAEAYDLGRPLPEIPPPFDLDIAEYRKKMVGIEVSKNYVERKCVLSELGVAGKMDRVVRFKAGPPLICDIKTTQNIEFAWGEIAIQLAIYAHADFIWDKRQKCYQRMLQVNQSQALVIHLPASQARCTPYLVDIAAGWEMVQTCRDVRAWRARKDLAVPLVESGG
jgi:hypothetical protein